MYVCVCSYIYMYIYIYICIYIYMGMILWNPHTDASLTMYCVWCMCTYHQAAIAVEGERPRHDHGMSLKLM